jgi:hypothetical protein
MVRRAGPGGGAQDATGAAGHERAAEGSRARPRRPGSGRGVTRTRAAGVLGMRATAPAGTQKHRTAKATTGRFDAAPTVNRFSG